VIRGGCIEPCKAASRFKQPGLLENCGDVGFSTPQFNRHAFCEGERPHLTVIDVYFAFGGVDDSSQEKSLFVRRVPDLSAVFDPIWGTMGRPDDNELCAAVVFGDFAGELLIIPVLTLLFRLVVYDLGPPTE
jgi:hypothetical protein